MGNIIEDSFSHRDVIGLKWCALCNGMGEAILACPNCDNSMFDQGRIYDFYDDYSPYMDIDVIKLADGDPVSSQKMNVFIYLNALIVDLMFRRKLRLLKMSNKKSNRSIAFFW